MDRMKTRAFRTLCDEVEEKLRKTLTTSTIVDLTDSSKSPDQLTALVLETESSA